MAQHPDATGPINIIYDPGRHASSFQVSGWRRGSPFVISGSLPVPVSPALTLREATEILSREALKTLLRELSENL